MKKFFAMILSSVLILAILPMGVANAESEFAQYLTCTITDGKITITGCDSAFEGHFEIPSIINGYPVTTISNSAFVRCKITGVTIPSTVSYIGNGAFSGCYNLTKVNITDVAAWCNSGISSYCFAYLDGVDLYVNNQPARHLVIPEGVEVIARRAFSYFENIEMVTFPASINCIRDQSFNGNLKKVNITDIAAWCRADFSYEWRYIEEYSNSSAELYLNGEPITHLVIPEGVNRISDWAFDSFINIESATMPKSIKLIGYGAFQGCSNLIRINITDLASWCSATKNDYLYKDTDLYSNNTLLTDVVVPDTVKTIGRYAFYHSTIKSITIPRSVTVIEEDAFRNCSNLEKVFYKGTEEEWRNVYLSTQNEALLDADITYSDIPKCECHTYDDIHDTVCNICDSVRMVTTLNATLPHKTLYYLGEVFDNTGMCVTAIYSDGTSGVITDYDISGFSSKTVGAKTVIVTYSGKTARIGVSVVDQNSPVFEIVSGTASKGSTVDVAISIKNNTGIVSVKLGIDYDTDVFEILSAKGADFDSVEFGPTNADPFIINWIDTVNPNNITEGDIAIITLKVKVGAPIGDNAITIRYNPEDVYDENFNNVAFAVAGGVISVRDYTPGDANCDGSVNNKDYGLLMQYLNGWDVSIMPAATDVNGDGLINNKDLGLLMQYLNSWDVILKPGADSLSTDKPSTNNTDPNGPLVPF